MANTNAGLNNSFRTPLLEEGMTYKEIGLSPEATQLLESRKYSAQEICRLLNVPLYKLGLQDSSQTYANAETINTHFYTDCLLPWITAFEQEAERKLLVGGERDKYIIRHNVDGLLRADLKTRYEVYKIGKDGGWLTDNDILASEDRPTYEGGDEHVRPLNMAPVAKEEPKPEEPEKAEPAEPTRSAPIDALAPVIGAAVERLAVKEFEAFNRARKRHQEPEALKAWADGFMLEHRTLVAAALAPVAEAAGALLGHLREMPTEAIDQYISGARQAGVGGAPDKICGHEYVVNNDMAQIPAVGNGSKIMVAGPFSRYKVRFVKGVEIMRLSEKYAEFFQVGFLGFLRADARTSDTSCFKHLAF